MLLGSTGAKAARRMLMKLTLEKLFGSAFVLSPRNEKNTAPDELEILIRSS